jgi:hypothetical protein
MKSDANNCFVRPQIACEFIIKGKYAKDVPFLNSLAYLAAGGG